MYTQIFDRYQLIKGYVGLLCLYWSLGENGNSWIDIAANKACQSVLSNGEQVLHGMNFWSIPSHVPISSSTIHLSVEPPTSQGTLKDGVSYWVCSQAT